MLLKEAQKLEQPVPLVVRHYKHKLKRNVMTRAQCKSVMKDYLEVLLDERLVHTVVYRLFNMCVQEVTELLHPELIGNEKLETRTMDWIRQRTAIVRNEVEGLLDNLDEAGTALFDALDSDGDGTVTHNDFLASFQTASRQIIDLRNATYARRSSCG